jgi:hypothetical protein
MKQNDHHTPAPTGAPQSRPHRHAQERPHFPHHQEQNKRFVRDAQAGLLGGFYHE